jgi:hypothetical protein
MGTEESDLPKLAAPARRALLGAGYTLWGAQTRT